MKMQRLIMLVVVAACVSFAAPAARAWDGGYGGCGGGGWDCGYGWLYNSLDYNVPYFAAHPPVYYSYPVPRTYGFSPFAYPPNVMTPELFGETQPQEIINPYVPSTQQNPVKADKPADKTAAAKSRPEPLVVLNPFVSADQSVAQSDR